MGFTASPMLCCIATAALLSAASASAAESADGKALATELFTYLGLDQAKRSQLKAGEVVHNGLSKAERLPDEIVAAGAMLLAKAPEAGVVVDAFLFAISHTFTDQVTGFGSSIRRGIGRDLVATELGKQLEETRRRVTGGPK